MESGPLKTTEGLNVGDVLTLATKMTDKTTGEDFWWKRFVVVMQQSTIHHVWTLTLKMRPDADKDLREIDLRSTKVVATFLPPEQWPQGVCAMHMKLVAQGVITLGKD